MKKTILILFTAWLTCAGAALHADAHAATGGKEPAGAKRAATKQEEKTVEVYPNPSNGVVNISLAGFEGKTELQIMNVIGNVVFSETINELDSRFTRTYDLSKYAKGLYYIKLESAGYSEMKKVIIR